MNELSCSDFRALLERSLLADGAPGSAFAAAGLSWNAHLVGCSSCRALLEAEEALDELLSSLPAPHLPRDLAERVLKRLQEERDPASASEPLDRLLELEPEPVAPRDLGRRVLVGLAAARQGDGAVHTRDLDVLLEAAWGDAPETSAQPALAARVLEGLAPERRAQERRRGFRLLGTSSRRAAAALFLTLGGWLFWKGLASSPSSLPSQAGPTGPNAANGTSVADVGAVSPRDEPVIAQLELLERWEDLMDPDVDLLLAQLDPADQALLELTAEEGQ